MLLNIYQTSSRLDVRQKGIMIAQIDRKFNEGAKNGSTFSFWATQMEVIGQKRRNGRNLLKFGGRMSGGLLCRGAIVLDPT